MPQPARRRWWNSGVGNTLVKILGWNILWAVASTLLNYLGGLGLALLLNKPDVKGSKVWRAFPILAYAIPGFISMWGFKFMFSQSGLINSLLTADNKLAEPIVVEPPAYYAVGTCGNGGWAGNKVVFKAVYGCGGNVANEFWYGTQSGDNIVADPC